MSKHQVISVKSKTFEMGINYSTPSRRKAADDILSLYPDIKAAQSIQIVVLE